MTRNVDSLQGSLSPEPPRASYVTGRLQPSKDSLASQRAMNLESSGIKLAFQTELLARALKEESAQVRYWSDFANSDNPTFSVSGAPAGIVGQIEASLKKSGIDLPERKQGEPHFHFSLKGMEYRELNELGLKLEKASSDLDRKVASLIGTDERERLRSDMQVQAGITLLENPASAKPAEHRDTRELWTSKVSSPQPQGPGAGDEQHDLASHGAVR